MMELNQFVVETLSQILEGITAAQKKENGGNIAAESSLQIQTANSLNGGTAGMFTVVDFDVSVVAETKGGGKGGIKVWGVEAGGGLERGVQNTSRVKFAVHVKLPQGTETPTQVFPQSNKSRSIV